MGDLLEIFRVFTTIAVVLSFILHCILAYAVYQDAQRLDRMPSRLFLVGPILWSLITLLSGVLGLAIYWLVHYSELADSSRSNNS